MSAALLLPCRQTDPETKRKSLQAPPNGTTPDPGMKGSPQCSPIARDGSGIARTGLRLGLPQTSGFVVSQQPQE